VFRRAFRINLSTAQIFGIVQLTGIAVLGVGLFATPLGK